jgi:tetratricopeptide (TPR) repeat protein
VLFEHLGAKPNSAREVYSAEVEASHVFVAIYKNGYGYIDAINGMTISGLEDELRITQRNDNVPRLIYVCCAPGPRDERLRELITALERDLTLAYYTNAAELHDRIREDVASVVATRFMDARDNIVLSEETPATILARATMPEGATQVINEIAVATLSHHVICLHGPAKSGKTTLAALYAQRHGATFARASSRHPRDVFLLCANALDPGHPIEFGKYYTFDDARRELMRRWRDSQATTFVVDECDFVEDLISVLDSVERGCPTRIVFTATQQHESAHSIGVPAFASPASNVYAGDRTAGHTDRQRELLSYLALAAGRLSSDDLRELVQSSSYHIEELTRDVQALADIIDEDAIGYGFWDDGRRRAYVSLLMTSAQKCRFYVARVLRLFARSGRMIRAHQVASVLGDGSEAKYTEGAATEAARNGDWRIGVPLIEELQRTAKSADAKARLFAHMLALVHPLLLSGNRSRVDPLIAEARELARQLGPVATRALREVEITSSSHSTLSEEDVGELEEIHRRLGNDGDDWNCARIGVELSAIYLASKRYDRVEPILRQCLEVFAREDDAYGMELAERNLASALTMLPGRDSDADELVQRIQRRASTLNDQRRTRAWLCNVLTRRFRRSERYAEAEERAREAITLARELHDVALEALNTINLANVFRDQAEFDKAVTYYNQAAALAQPCGRRDIEADASRFVAATLNEKAEAVGGVDVSVSAYYAEHAIGLLRGTTYYEAAGDAHLELGNAYRARREPLRAAESYFVAASYFLRTSDGEAFAHAFDCAMRSTLPNHFGAYLRGVRTALAAKTLQVDPHGVTECIELLRTIVSRAPREALLSILSQHLHYASYLFAGRAKHYLTRDIIEVIRADSATNSASDHWRRLYAGLAVIELLHAERDDFLVNELATSIAERDDALHYRAGSTFGDVWTCVWRLDRAVSITIAPLDDTYDVKLVCLATALFLRSFTDEFAEEFVQCAGARLELRLFVGRYDHAPEDIRVIADDGGLLAALEFQPCAVARPASADDVAVMPVFLRPDFMSHMVFGVHRGGSMQVLLAKILIEVIHYMLRGEVSVDVLSPKVLGIVRRTIP